MKSAIVTDVLKEFPAWRTALFAAVFAAVLGGRIAYGQVTSDWQTMDVVQLSPAGISKGGKIAFGPKGTLYNVGWVWSSGGPIGGTYGAAVRVSSDRGQSWTTTSISTTSGWAGTEFNGLAFDPAGCLVTAGEIWDPNPNNHKDWVVQRSCDGVEFSLLDSNQDGHCPSAQEIAFSATGDLYVGGFAQGFDVPFLWEVRKSSDGGATWQTVDRAGTVDSNGAYAIACPKNGNVFVSGSLSYLNKGIAQERWTVRRTVNHGINWTTVDSFQENASCESAAMASAVDQAGYIYVAGWAQNLPKKNTVVTDWVLRRSMDNGITWSVSDKFSLASGHPVSPLAMTVDLKGNIWVCGYTEQNDGTYPMHWIVRKGTPGANGTVTWAEVDNYQLVSGQHARANGITSDDAGNIYVSGRGNDSAGATFWIVRKLTAK